MIVPLIGREGPSKTEDVGAREIQTLIDFAAMAPVLEVWMFCQKCKVPLTGSNGFSDSTWTLRCGCRTLTYQRKPAH